jgi:hypothetical protein
MSRAHSDIGLDKAITNLRDAAQALLNFERAKRIHLCASRRADLTRLSKLTLEQFMDEAFEYSDKR